MTNTSPKRAKRQQLIAAVEIAGPSGAGKTLGGLLIAYGMMKEKYPDMDDYDLWGKIGLVDTEHERSLVYEGMTHQGVKIGEFWHQPLENDYSVSKYQSCVRALKKAGVEVVIIDSISHAWEGSNGLLDLQQSKGGSFGAWRDVNPIYNDFIKLVTGEEYKIHTISTVRQKQDYQIDRTETGKLEIKKLGLKHVQRDSLEYEFQVVFNVDMEHLATVTKDNSGLFEGKQAALSPEHGKKLIQWLDKGIDVKGKEEEERQTFIANTRGLANFRSELDDKLKELEKLAKKPLDEFDIRLAERAFGILNKLMADLETQEKAAQAQ
jgi:AAA domain